MQLNFTRRFLLGFLLIFLLQHTISAQVLRTGFENAVIPDPPPNWIVTNTNNSNWQSLDGNTYEGNKCMYLADSYYGDTSDAWLISPEYSFEAGKKYSISFYYKNQSNNNNTLQLTLGSNTTPASQTEIIWEKSFTNIDYQKAQINYTATETGIKHIALHCTTPVTFTYLYVDNFLTQKVAAFEPLNPTVTNVTTSSTTASWDAVTGAAKYEYGLSDTLTPPTSTSFTTNTTINVTGLNAATQYYFYVRTVLANGNTSNWAVAGFASAYDPKNFPVLSCGTFYENDFIGGTGIYNGGYCDQQAFGKEFFHKFIPTQTGNYNLNAYFSNDGQSTLFAYKDSADGAGPDGWTCIGQTAFFGSAKYSFGELKAGKTYYIMEKTIRPVTLPTSYAYSIDCYEPEPPNDSCQNATEITSSSQYNDSCTGTLLTTLGASPNDPSVWIKFKATDDAQLFRFKNMVYKNVADPTANPGITIEIYSAQCDFNTLVDNGQVDVKTGVTKDIYSYKLHKDSTYYCRFYVPDVATAATFNLCIMNLDITAGISNKCAVGLPYTINKNTDGDNTKLWVPITDKSYKIIGEINAQGNNLSKVAASVFVNDGALRTDETGMYYLDRSFSFRSAITPATPVKVRLFISNDELNKLIAQTGSNVNSVSDIKISQNENTCSSAIINIANDFITPYLSGDYDDTHKFIEFETDHLSSFYLRGGDQVLPTTLLSFTASQVNSSVLIQWKTAQEINVKNYVVERSDNARTFIKAATVTATGNDNKQHDYSYNDATVSQGKYYYRLITVDNDGSEKYSNIVSVDFNGANGIAVTPNPFTDKITITTNEVVPTNYNLSITDLSGKIIQTKTIKTIAGNNTQTIYLQNIPAGLYVLKMNSAKTTKVIKIVKQ